MYAIRSYYAHFPDLQGNYWENSDNLETSRPKKDTISMKYKDIAQIP